MNCILSNNTLDSGYALVISYVYDGSIKQSAIQGVHELIQRTFEST